MTQIHELVLDLLRVEARQHLKVKLSEAKRALDTQGRVDPDGPDYERIEQLLDALYAPPVDPTPDDTTVRYYMDNHTNVRAKHVMTHPRQEIARRIAFAQAEAQYHWEPAPLLEATVQELYQDALAHVHGMDPYQWTRDPSLDPGVRDLIRSTLIMGENPDGTLRSEQDQNDWKVFFWLEYESIKRWDLAHMEPPPSDKEEDYLRPSEPEPYDGLPALDALDVQRQRDCPKCFGNGHVRDHAFWRPDASRSVPRQEQLGTPASAPCLNCEGKGKLGWRPCWPCGGTGMAEAQCAHCRGTGFDPFRDYIDPVKQPRAKKGTIQHGIFVPQGKILVELPAGRVLVTKPTGDTRTCPACSAPMWSNIVKNREREKQGKRLMPQYACCACSTVIWANGGLSFNQSPRLGVELV